MKGLLLFLLATQSAVAGTVLIPAFTPEDPSDKAHADRFHDALLLELIAAGHTPIGQDALRSRIGRFVDSCATTVDCPKRMFKAWPAPVAIIGEVYADDDAMGVVTTIYKPGQARPVKVFDQSVADGGDWTAVQEILKLVAELSPKEDKSGAAEEDSLADDISVALDAQKAQIREERKSESVVERLGKVDPAVDELSDDEILDLLGLGEEKPEEANLVTADEPAVASVEADDPKQPELPVEEEQPAKEKEPEQAEEIAKGEEGKKPEEDLEEKAPELLAEPVEADEPVLPAQDDGEPAVEEDFEPAELLVAEEELDLDAELDLDLAPRKRASPAPTPDASKEERKEMNLDPVLFGMYRRSPLSKDAWFQKWRPHVNHGHIELFGSVVYGDVIRDYDVRVTLDASSLTEVGVYQRDVFTSGVGYEAGAAIGYTPVPWLDLSALFSVWGVSKTYTTAWATVEDVYVQDSDIYVHAPIPTWQAIIEPRARLYLLPVSWVKLYALGGVSVRVVDAFEVPDLNLVNYPDRPSWTSVGWMVGGGLMVDPHEDFGIYIEAPLTHWFANGDRYESQTGVVPPITPPNYEQTGWVLRGVLGVQFRL